MSSFVPGPDGRLRFASRWIRLGDPTPEMLGDARRQLHWAVQLLASFAEALVPRRPDDSHAAVTWSPERRAFLSEESGDGSELRLGLQPGELVYRLYGPAPTRPEVFEARGRTLAEAAAWLETALAARTGGATQTFRLLEPDIAYHRVAAGATFDAAPADLAELERWFHDAFLLLEAVSIAEEGASPVRVWPHHFDIAVLIELGAEDDRPVDPEEARSVGVGMTPGDDSYPDPYWYVTPWPYPAATGLPKLPPPGAWHTEGWVGAVLGAADLVGAGDERAQATRAASFARAAIAGCRELLR